MIWQIGSDFVVSEKEMDEDALSGVCTVCQVRSNKRRGGVPKIEQDFLRKHVLKILHPGKNCHWTPLWSCHLLPLSGFLQVCIVIVFNVFITIITKIMLICVQANTSTEATSTV